MTLIERLEAEPEGSRELDAEIAVAVGHADPTATYDKDNDCLFWYEPHEMGMNEPMSAPLHDYTTSMDAADTLALEGWSPWDVIHRYCTPERFDAVPVLALCAAWMRAREAVG